MNLPTMRSALRSDLHDEEEDNYRWSDDELDRHIARSLAEFSQSLPLEQTTDLATTSGSHELDISGLSDRVIVEAVEYPTGGYPPAYQRFAVWGDTLTLLSDSVPDGRDARIYYGRLHTLDSDGSTIPGQYEDLVALGAAGYALNEWANFAVNRVNVGGGDTALEYRTQGEQRLARLHRELMRLGRHNRVRARQLYTPARPSVSRSTVAGP